MLEVHTKTQGLKSHYKPSLVNIPLPALCDLKSYFCVFHKHPSIG